MTTSGGVPGGVPSGVPGGTPPRRSGGGVPWSPPFGGPHHQSRWGKDPTSEVPSGVPTPSEPRSCRSCGCTDNNACWPPWARLDLKDRQP